MKIFILVLVFHGYRMELNEHQFSLEQCLAAKNAVYQHSEFVKDTDFVMAYCLPVERDHD